MNFIKLINCNILTDLNQLNMNGRLFTENNVDKIEYFKIEIMDGISLIEVTLNNEKYLKKFEYLFDVPTKEEVINFLIFKDRFEEIIMINKGENFCNLKKMSERIDDDLLKLKERLMNL